MSRSQVEDLLGEPDFVVRADLPESGLFGPQEALYGPLSGGDRYEEWRYDLGDSELYVWFAGADRDPSKWTLVLSAEAPKGAIY